MTQLEQEMTELLDEIKITLASLHGTRTTRDAEDHNRALHNECPLPIFINGLRQIDVEQELEDIDLLLGRVNSDG